MEEFRAPELHLIELQSLLLSEETLESTLARVVRLACAGVQGCDAVGVTLVEDSKPTTAAATDDFALEIDQHQYDSGEGPCLDAYRTGEMHEIEDASQEKRWPGYVSRALEEGLGSSLSYPLSVRNQTLGALNIYSKKPNAFDDESRVVASQFAAQAAVTLANAQLYASTQRLVNNLTEALKSRERIGQAKGILMAQQNLSDEEAFEMLVKLSQTSNVKLREIAQKIVDRANQRD